MTEDLDAEILTNLQNDLQILMSVLTILSRGKPNVTDFETNKRMWMTAKLLEENANISALEPFMMKALKVMHDNEQLLDGLVTLEEVKNASGFMRDLVLTNTEIPEKDAVKFCEDGLAIVSQPWRPSCISEIVMSLEKARSLLLNPFKSSLQLRLAVLAYEGCGGENDDEYRAWITQSFCRFVVEGVSDQDILDVTQLIDAAERNPRLCHALAIAIRHLECLRIENPVLFNIIQHVQPKLSNELKILPR